MQLAFECPRRITRAFRDATGASVKRKDTERLRKLCALAANEADHDRLIELLKKINDLFQADEKSQADEKRVRAAKQTPEPR